MNQLLEWLPLLVFFAAFKFAGIYWATAALMIAYATLMFVHRWQTGSYKPMHVGAVALVLVLGGLTLLFHDKRFIQWKPTLVLGVFACAFLGSSFIGKQPLVRRMFEGVFPEPIELPNRSWTRLNLLWVAWFALLAAANLYVAWNFSDNVWFYFHFVGVSVATLVFMIPQVLWLSGKSQHASDPGLPHEEREHVP